MKYLRIFLLPLVLSMIGFDCWGQDVIITPKSN